MYSHRWIEKGNQILSGHIPEDLISPAPPAADSAQALLQGLLGTGGPMPDGLAQMLMQRQPNRLRTPSGPFPFPSSRIG